MHGPHFEMEVGAIHVFGAFRERIIITIDGSAGQQFSDELHNTLKKATQASCANEKFKRSFRKVFYLVCM